MPLTGLRSALLIVEGTPRMRKLIQGILRPLVSHIEECTRFDQAPFAYLRTWPDLVFARPGHRTFAGHSRFA